MKTLTIPAVALALLVSGTVIAEGPHDKAIEARQAMFKLYGYHFGTLSAMAKGKIDYNAEMAAEMASNLDAVAHLGQTSLWPAGSDNATDGNATTRALPAIWDNIPDVIEKSMALQEASTALVAAAGTDLDSLKGAIGPVGNACKACHDDYRAKRR